MAQRQKDQKAGPSPGECEIMVFVIACLLIDDETITAFYKVVDGLAREWDNNRWVAGWTHDGGRAVRLLLYPKFLVDIEDSLRQTLGQAEIPFFFIPDEPPLIEGSTPAVNARYASAYHQDILDRIPPGEASACST